MYAYRLEIFRQMTFDELVVFVYTPQFDKFIVWGFYISSCHPPELSRWIRGDHKTNQGVPGCLRKMIVRSFGAQSLRQCTRRPPPSTRAIVRKFSTPSFASESPVPTAHPLVGVTSQFDHVAPKFEIQPSQIEILNSPTAFYETLKVVDSNPKMRQTG